MTKVIINSENTRSEYLKELIACCQGAGLNDITLVGASATDAQQKNITCLNMSFGAGLASMAVNSSEALIMINASSEITPIDLSKALSNLNTNNKQTIRYTSSSKFGAKESLSATISNFNPAIFNSSIPSPSIVSIQGFDFSEAQSSSSYNSFVWKLFIKAMKEGKTPELTAEFASAKITLSEAEAAEILEYFVNESNIEELFPEHNWKAYPEECAAASYHTLAALFIKLGAPERATDCLRLSDELEESPRSLALKGIIALTKGETLGAVANMVSSLRQYEERKIQKMDHYLSFSPENMEIINDNLTSGLKALNEHNNEKAFTCFASAVFNFDNFYSELGIDSLKAS